MPIGAPRQNGGGSTASAGTGTGGTALTAAQIKARYESNTNTEAFTTAEQTKLDGSEASATADQTGSEIKAAYEGESDTNAFTNALLTKLNGIATAATAVSVVQVLALILAGTGININRSVGGQITLSATGGGGGGSGTADGVVNQVVFDETTQIVTLSTTSGGTVTVDLSAFITSDELTTALASYLTDLQAMGLYASLFGANFQGNVRLLDGVVGSIVVGGGGSGYAAGTTLVIAAPPSGGIQATADVTVSGGAVTAVTITNPGSGYTFSPGAALANTGGGLSATLGISLLRPTLRIGKAVPTLIDEVTRKDYVDGLVTGFAPLADPALTGDPTAPTQNPNDNSTKLATTAYVLAAVNALIAAAPSTLDTLNELADALGDDANFATTVSDSLAEKAALAGAAFTGVASGISPVGATDFVTLSYFQAHRNISPIMDDLYFGTSDDAVPTGSELNISGMNGMGVIPAYSGDKHLLIARVASEGDISMVTFSDDSSGSNQFGAFSKFASTITPQGDVGLFSVWVSNQLLSQPAELTITVN